MSVEDKEQRENSFRRSVADRKTRDLTRRLNEVMAEVDFLSAHIERMEGTFCWRLRTALKLKPRKLIWWSLTLRLGRKLRERRHQTGRSDYDCTDPKQYRAWIAINDRRTAGRNAAILDHIAEMSEMPLISVVMPVYDSPEGYLTEAINSVRAQLYPRWELCIADDASTSPHVAELLKKLAAEDSRIKVMRREQNGNISAASNSALELATGTFVALMDHDDLLPAHALYEVACAIEEDPELDIIYSDEDRIEDNGLRSAPYFKPDFSESLMLGHNMLSHLGVYRRSLIQSIGGFRVGFEGSQDYDLALRAYAATSAKKILHIPQVLYHWRKNSEAQSFSERQLDRCADAARRAIRDYLGAKGEVAAVIPNPVIPSWTRIKRSLPAELPLVSVIIPTKDRADLLAMSAKGVLQQTDYPRLELIIVNNNSEKQETFALLAELKRDERVTVLDHPYPFNYSAINNAAVRIAKGEILAFLNNDIEVLEPDWLQEMVSEAIRVDVGAVGAKLFYPNGRIQHAGVVIGFGGVAGHSFCMQDKKTIGYFGFAVLKRNVSAVTAACMVVRKSIFDEVGGFDETNLPVAYNDVDLCLKIMETGYQNIWTPYAVLNHHESASRGYEDTPEKQARSARECEYMRSKWSALILRDPFYNPNFSLYRDWGHLARSGGRGRT